MVLGRVDRVGTDDVRPQLLKIGDVTLAFGRVCQRIDVAVAGLTISTSSATGIILYKFELVLQMVVVVRHDGKHTLIGHTSDITRLWGQFLDVYRRNVDLTIQCRCWNRRA